MSNLLKHAERELSLIGYNVNDNDNDPMNDLAKSNIFELLKTFSNQGHSGFSANYVCEMFYKLAKYEVLSPLTGNDDEWTDVSNTFNRNETLFQNNRVSAVFKTDKGCFYTDAIVWIDEKNFSFTNLKSRGYIKSFPFTPKTFYVRVDESRNVVDHQEYAKALEYYKQQ